MHVCPSAALAGSRPSADSHALWLLCPPHALAGLAAPDGRAIRLDRLLHGSLFNKKEAEQEGSTVSDAALRRRLLDKLQVHHRLLRPGEQVLAAGGRANGWLCGARAADSGGTLPCCLCAHCPPS